MFPYWYCELCHRLQLGKSDCECTDRNKIETRLTETKLEGAR